jgi:DNA-binding winged helix-turn-helix (wHTH) protein
MTAGSARLVAAPGRILEVFVGHDQLELRPKERAVLAALALRHPESQTVDLLITMVWPVDKPSTARQSIHNHLARIRKVAPSLVDSSSTGYRLAPNVEIVVPTVADDRDDPRDPNDVLVEFAGVPSMRPARTAFARRHRARDDVDPVDLIRNGHAAGVIEDFRRAVLHDPLDERAWWTLAIATAATSGGADAGEVLDRARDALLEVGLEPGRRLLDLDRMIRDGVVSPSILLVDPFGSDIGNRLGELERAVAIPLETVRSALESGAPVVIEIEGPDGFLRRELLARLIDTARGKGFATRAARVQQSDIGPPTPRAVHVGVRPVVTVVDGGEFCTDTSRLVAMLSGDDASGHRGVWVVTSDRGVGFGESVAAALADEGAPLGVEHTSIPSGTTHFDELGVPRSRGVRRLVSVLALLGESVRLDAIAPLVGSDAGAAALHAARAGLVRADAAAHLVDLASPHVGHATLAAIDDAELNQLTEGLAALVDDDHDEPRRATRRAGFALAAFGPSAETTIDATRAAARLHADRGDFTAAAATLERTSLALEAAHGLSTTWCALQIEAGQARLSGGDPSGDTILRSVIEFATSVGEGALAASATLEWCRLGMAARAGSFDPDRLAVVEGLLDISTDPLEQAQLGAAASMVLSLADRPELLRRHFVDAVEHANASTNAQVLADVLPLTYMSLPLHDDVDGRLANGARLIELADELGRPDARWEGLQLVYSSQLMRGDPAFRDSFDALRAVAVHERSRSWEMQFIRSNIALVDGDLESARRHIDESLAYSTDVHEERVAAVFGVHHLVAALIDGDAGSFLESVRTLATEQPGVGAWQAALAVCAASAGDTATALAAARRTIGDGVIDLRRDPTYTAGLVSLGEAVAILRDEPLAATMLEHLEPFAGWWSWCGSCTFGPIDLTRARLALVLGRARDAEKIASSAVENCAAMRAPRFADAATGVLLEALAAH